MAGYPSYDGHVTAAAAANNNNSNENYVTSFSVNNYKETDIYFCLFRISNICVDLL